MRVGFKVDVEAAQLASLRRIARTKYEGVARHEVVFLPREHALAGAAERQRMEDEFVRRCDVVVGVLDDGVLAARRRLGRDVPFVFFPHGQLAGGGWSVRDRLGDLTTRDVMVVNCTAEVEIARRLFANATVRMLPFAFDASTFHVIDDGEKRAARQRLRFRESDRIILYAGRILPEKNVHTLLRIFDVLCRHVPDAHLVLAGSVGVPELGAFGVQGVWPSNTFFKLISRMERSDRVHTMAPRDDQRLRELYGIADVKVNLTLNPDENFGLAQVEAMACGTPVVGTAWGGLKDTIADGVTGRRVSTVPTGTGMKFSWWEALNHLVAMLEGEAREMRPACARAAARYSQLAFNARMEEILVSLAAGRGGSGQPLRATPFAEELWSVCDPRDPGPPFRRGPRSEALYRELITPFSGVSGDHVAPGEPLEPGQVLTLATPVHACGGAVRPDDVFYPYEVQPPGPHGDAVGSVLARMRERPALTAGELAAALDGCVAGGEAGLAAALGWMHEAGLVLRTRPRPEWLDPATVGPRMAVPAFAVQRVERAETDLVVFG